MRMKNLLALLLCVLMLPAAVLAEGLEPLPMNDLIYGPEPKDACYLSDTEYVDESISVRIYADRYADTDYFYAHVKISHPSQLRTMPASIYAGTSQRARTFNFKQTGTIRGRYVAKLANAVIAVNGDYHAVPECTVVLRMGKQYRNAAQGNRDLLVIDYNGDFSTLTTPTKKEYAAYYEANKDSMYQVMCFGPLLVKDGVSIIAPDYRNSAIGATKDCQRTAICQLGPLEYMLVTALGNQTKGNKGLTIYEFAQLCELAGKRLKPEGGCRIAYNLDGGNSSAMLFKRYDAKYNKLLYTKVNCPEIERDLSDIVYFATLVK